MSKRLRTSLRTLIAVAMVAVAAAATTPSAAAAPQASGAAATSVPAGEATYRHYLGTATASTDFRTSVPHAGRYAVQYAVTGTAFFDTYLGGQELGYVGGVTGTYTTKSVWLTAGRHVVHVVGPEGSGSARVYLLAAH